jgi:NADPH:quinone reductase-like Zn-dependent oxidoreductase
LTRETIDIPLAGDDEVRVRVHAASVCKGDIHLLTGTPYLVRLMGIGLFRAKHRVQGQSMAGRVEAVGKNVTSFQLGDAVYGQVPFGAFAEYVCIPASELAPKPANLSFEEAAAIPDSGLTALQGLRDVGQLQRGQNVLINGASRTARCWTASARTKRSNQRRVGWRRHLRRADSESPRGRGHRRM